MHVLCNNLMKRLDRLKFEWLPRLFGLADREKNHKNNRGFNIIIIWDHRTPEKISVCVLQYVAGRARNTQIIIYYELPT